MSEDRKAFGPRWEERMDRKSQALQVARDMLTPGRTRTIKGI